MVVMVAWLGLFAGIVQLLDAGIGRVHSDLATTLGSPAIPQFAALIPFLA
jgi:hypothetical protein